MSIIITLLILAAIIAGIYTFVKNDGNREITNSNPSGGTVYPGSSQWFPNTSGSGSGKPLGKIETPDVVEQAVKTKKVTKKKEDKKPAAKKGRKPKNDQQDQLLLS